MTISKWRMVSAETKISYTKWFSNICGVLSPLDWSTVHKMIEQDMLKQSISKTVDQQ
jgi:hypothetical protein